MQVMAIDDPRKFSVSQMGNVAMQFIEPLVRWNPGLHLPADAA